MKQQRLAKIEKKLHFRPDGAFQFESNFSTLIICLLIGGRVVSRWSNRLFSVVAVSHMFVCNSRVARCEGPAGADASV